MISRAGWHGRDEESRAYLQARLTLLSKLAFWSFIVLLGGMVALYAQYPHIQPKYNSRIYVIATAGLVCQAIVWRGWLVRRQLDLKSLYAIDMFYAFASGAIFGGAIAIAYDFRPSAEANSMWAVFLVFLRTIVVPSTGRRTVITGTLTLLPIVIGRIYITPYQPLPPLAHISSSIIVSTVVVLLASIGSDVLYGLRRKVSEATRLGQYTLDRKIGEGGNGSVYRARHAMLRRPTAIKRIQPEKAGVETLDRFEREVQHMSQLTHWNTVAVYDYGRSPDGVFYYAMEYLDGIDLENLVIDFGAQPAGRVISILTQMCAALGEAHRRGVIHRDIKPANVILCERGEVPDVAKVVDFGLAKEIDKNSGDTKQILGTPAYIAPEAVTDPDTIGPAADLYAVGCVGYFLLTGRRVFEGKTSVDLCVQHVTAVPKPPSTMTTHPIPPALEQIILRCLAKQPSERPEDAATLAKLLRDVPHTWTDDAATAWWKKFREQDRPLGASASTLTITVDLGDRIPAS
jgi:serine/threonine-protein kinase